MSRHLFRLSIFLGLALVLLLQIGVWSPLQSAARAETAPVATINQSYPAVIAAEDAGNTYLNKLFGSFGSTDNAVTEQSSGPLEWFLIIFGTLVYGQIAMLVALWILFTADLLGIIVGLVLIAIILGFTLPRKPRAIALFVLACLNFVLGAAITVVMAATEGVPPILGSLIPLGALVWLALRQLQFHFSAALKS